SDIIHQLRHSVLILGLNSMILTKKNIFGTIGIKDFSKILSFISELGKHFKFLKLSVEIKNFLKHYLNSAPFFPGSKNSVLFSAKHESHSHFGMVPNLPILHCLAA